MKIAKLEWCTERELNQGRLVYLRSNVKPLQDYRNQDFVALNDIGTRSDYCQNIRFDSEQRLEKIDVFYDTTAVQALKIQVFDG